MRTEKQIKKAQLKLLEETMDTYNTGNRAIIDSPYKSCQYSPIKGKSPGCAIGRLIPKELAATLDKKFTFNNKKPEPGSGVSNPKLFKLLPEKLKELGNSFLTNLQQLHDGKYYWNEKGISSEGRRLAKSIKKQFHL